MDNDNEYSSIFRSSVLDENATAAMFRAMAHKMPSLALRLWDDGFRHKNPDHNKELAKVLFELVFANGINSIKSLGYGGTQKEDVFASVLPTEKTQAGHVEKVEFWAFGRSGGYFSSRDDSERKIGFREQFELLNKVLQLTPESVSVFEDIFKKVTTKKPGEIFDNPILDGWTPADKKEDFQERINAFVYIIRGLDVDLVNKLSVNISVPLWGEGQSPVSPLVVLSHLGANWSYVKETDALFGVLASIKSQSGQNLSLFNTAIYPEQLMKGWLQNNPQAQVERWEEWLRKALKNKNASFDYGRSTLLGDLHHEMKEAHLTNHGSPFLDAFFEAWPHIDGWHLMHGSRAKLALDNEAKKVVQSLDRPDLKDEVAVKDLLVVFLGYAQTSSESTTIKALKALVEATTKSQSAIIHEFANRNLLSCCVNARRSAGMGNSKNSSLNWDDLKHEAFKNLLPDYKLEDFKANCTGVWRLPTGNLKKSFVSVVGKHQFIIETIQKLEFKNKALAEECLVHYKSCMLDSMKMQIAFLDNWLVSSSEKLEEKLAEFKKYKFSESKQNNSFPTDSVYGAAFSSQLRMGSELVFDKIFTEWMLITHVAEIVKTGLWRQSNLANQNKSSGDEIYTNKFKAYIDWNNFVLQTHPKMNDDYAPYWSKLVLSKSIKNDYPLLWQLTQIISNNFSDVLNQKEVWNQFSYADLLEMKLQHPGNQDLNKVVSKPKTRI